MNTKLLNKTEISDVLSSLNAYYPNPRCGLIYTTPLELLLSLILAAQCTDERVNIIRPRLTLKYPSLDDLIEAGVSNIYNEIKSCSFPNNKARHIYNACLIIKNKFNGKVPNSMNELTSIPGIGRKSANIILSECFGTIEGIAVDTHVTRLSKKIGFTNSTNVNIIEKDLMKKIPKNIWSNINHTLVTHGKTICIARKPKCDICPINKLCREYKKRAK